LLAAVEAEFVEGTLHGGQAERRYVLTAHQKLVPRLALQLAQAAHQPDEAIFPDVLVHARPVLVFDWDYG
jgi:hypothetical protein